MVAGAGRVAAVRWARVCGARADAHPTSGYEEPLLPDRDLNLPDVVNVFVPSALQLMGSWVRKSDLEEVP